MNDIAPSNSDKSREVARRAPNKKYAQKQATQRDDKRDIRKKLAPVVKSPVTIEKPTAWSRFKNSFLGEGGNIGEFIVYDILVPAFRNTLADMGFGVVDMIFGGGRGRGGSRNNDSRVIRDRGRSYIDYGASQSRNRYDERRDIDRNDRARHDFSSIVYTKRGEAEEVLSRLVDLTIEYNEATVAALYELSDMDSVPSDHNYGWTNLRDAYTERVRNGYIIKFPQARPL